LKIERAKIMKAILMCGLLFFTTASIFVASGQERQREEKGGAQTTNSKQANDQVEVKTDRFSGVITIKLKPQLILDKPDHQLTIEIETKLGEKGKLDFEKDDVAAEVWFRSLYKGSVNFGDKELHFIIDGKPLHLGEMPEATAEATDENMRRQRGFTIKASFVAIFDRRAFEQFSKATRVEMRFGPIELSLNQSAVSVLRDYANQVLAQHKIAKERKQ
jgi:hypothetical protein